MKTREQYLTKCAEVILRDQLMPLVEGSQWDYPLPPVKISVGFPPGTRGGKVAACCCPRAASAGGFNEIFVNPTYDDPIYVLGNLVHELIHAIDDCASGHKGFFASIARKVGLDGKLTATVPGEALTAQLAKLVKRYGEFPHEQLKLGAARKKDGTRQLKVECEGCGFIFRTSQKWIDMLHDDSPCPACGDSMLSVK